MLVKLYLTIIGIIKQIDSNMSKLMKRAIRYKHTDHNYRKVLLKKIFYLSLKKLRMIKNYF